MSRRRRGTGRPRPPAGGAGVLTRMRQSGKASGLSGPPSRRRLPPHERWRLAVVVGAAGTCAFVVVGRRIEGEGLGGAILLALLSVAVLSTALFGVQAAAGASNPTRRWAATVLVGMMAGGFALALGTVAPGTPLVMLAAQRSGASAALGPEAAGKTVTLRVRGEIEPEAKGNVDFVVAVGDLAVEGRLVRLKRHLRVGRRYATTKSVTAFHRRLEMPDRARDIRVTRLIGPLDGPLRVELLPQLAPPWAGLAFAATGVVLALVLERKVGSKVYGLSVGAGLGALASVTGWARPAAELEEVAVLMVAGGILGGIASALSTHLPAAVRIKKEAV